MANSNNPQDELAKEKARLYRIISSTNQWLVLSRMKVHGFWPRNQGLPEDPEPERLERQSIEKEINQLKQQHSKLKNPQKALAEERIRRWKESKERRKLAKQKQADAAEQRRARFAALKAKTVLHSGTGYSFQLQQSNANPDKLRELSLPLLRDPTDLAKHLDISLGQVRWLTYHRKGATIVHYHRYDVPKKTGGVRAISAPKPHLAGAQQVILSSILEPIATHSQAHGFVKQRSIVSNASPHSKAEVLINLDLLDFFPTIKFARVKGLFKQFGYSPQVANLLALICTEPPRLPVKVHDKPYFIAIGDRQLPQGACTSPALTNILCKRLDARLHGLAKAHNCVYTRYADDLAFSTQTKDLNIGHFLAKVRAILKSEGLKENPKKTHITRSSQRQEVTGLTVNERPTVSRKERKKLRAILHNICKNGWSHENRNNHPRFKDHICGKVAFLKSVDPKHATQFQSLLESALKASH